MRGILPSRRRLQAWARTATAVWIAAVQLVLILAPLSEIPDGAGAPGIAQIGASLAPQPAVSTRGPVQHQHVHNEATCPACIARSLHARLEAFAPLPASAVEHSTPVESYSSSPRPADPPSSNLSRAPPVA